MTRRVVCCLMFAAMIAGCSSPLGSAPKHVQAALDPFLKAGYACTGGTSDQSAHRQWRCDRQVADTAQYSVVVDADDSGVKAVTATVDQSLATSTKREVALDFFADVIQIDVGGSAQDIQAWVDGHLADGGQGQVGPALVTLDKLQAVDHLVVFRTS